ncbi:MAG: zinc ribbon domain-containing protein [Pseudomonadota bacterium]
MKCPKCQFEQADNHTICVSCKLVFSKYFYQLEQQSKIYTQDAPNNLKTSDGASRVFDLIYLRQRLFPEPPISETGTSLFIRALLIAVIAFYTVKLIAAGKDSNYAGESFLHLVNLPFHEAGHVFFGIFGQFIGSLGGTLGQLIMPLICCYVLLVQQEDAFGAAVAFWWFAENFVDIAPYINDARAGILPLVGGSIGKHAPYGFHDWEYLLSETGLIRYDQHIAQISHITGSLLMLVALLWASRLLWLWKRKL